MLHLVCLKIGDLADLQQPVFRHGGCPCQLASGVIALVVGQQHPDIADDAAHHGLIDVIRQVVFLRLAKVSLHGVAQSIKGPGDDLRERN